MSLSKSTSSDARIYVGNLPQFVRNRELEEFFDKYGNIRGVDIHNKFDPAFAFIEFEDARDAEDAVHGEDGKRFDGQRIKVQFPRGNARGSGGGGSYGRSSSSSAASSYVRGRGRGMPIRRSENRILVSGLPVSGSWQDLKDHMREAGEVVYADVYKDGTAVCEFKSHRDMEWAIKYLDDSKFKSHENETTCIRIKEDSSYGGGYSPRGRSRSRSFSRDRSRSRSRSPRRERSRTRSRSPRRRSRSR